ncbi:magnesium chelatase [Streptomyces sp. BV333]|nr:magnesium chelatase [Streptomyces sp. BV333]
MAFARTYAVTLVGVEGIIVEVQADLEPGVASFALVGLPDKTLVESRDRVRAAVAFPVKFICSPQVMPLGAPVTECCGA